MAENESNVFIMTPEASNKKPSFLKRLLDARRIKNTCDDLLKPVDPDKEIVYEDGFEIFRNACPRNCYDTCSINTYVKNGVIQYVEGAPESTFTNGGLCAKGYSYFRRVYSPDRIKYPMMQKGRGTGNWKRISWNQALERIAEKILAIKEKDNSLLGLCLAQDSGHMGITNHSPKGMMSSLGYTTQCAGTPCWPAGIDAQAYDMGTMWCNDPEDFVHSRYIVLWGVNPAWCSIHTMKFIFKAQERGATVLCIDPVFTQTAAKSDLYWQIKTGSDGALALGMTRHLLDMGLMDQNFIKNHAVGFDDFKNYLKNEVTLEWASDISGIPAKEIASVAEAFASSQPATIWIGYGMQRHKNGGANVRCIDALGAATGIIGKIGGGVRYGHLSNRIFNYKSQNMDPPEGSRGMSSIACLSKTCRGNINLGSMDPEEETDRIINTNQLAREILEAKDPPIRMVWVTCRNPFSQDFNRPLLEKAFKGLEMVVVVEQFFTQTTSQADIVLPVTSMFEEWSINVSYWHYWLSINQPAIAPLYECKSNTEIAAMLSKKINAMAPGSCTFPTEIDAKQCMADEFNSNVNKMFGISSWEGLLDGPVKAKMPQAAWPDLKFDTPSGKYEFRSDLAEKHGHSPLPIYCRGRRKNAPFRVLTPHSKFSIHSQFQNLDYMEDFNPEPHVCIHPKPAAKKGIKDGEMVIIKNKIGQLTVKARITTNVRADELVLYETWFKNQAYCVQNLVDDASSDMGSFMTGAPGAAIHDQFADIEKLDKSV